MRHWRRSSFIFLCLVLATTACSGSAESESDGESGTESAADSASAPAETASEATTGDASDCASAVEGVACTLTEFQPPITVPVAAGWHYFPAPSAWDDQAAQFGRSDSETSYLSFNSVRRVYDYADPASVPAVTDAPSDVEGMVEFLTTRPGMTMSDPVDTTVAGHPAVQIDGEVTDTPSAVASEPDSCPMGPRAGELLLFAIGECSDDAVPGEDYDLFWLAEDTRVRITVVDVEEAERPLVIVFEDAVDSFEETAVQADEMLAGLQIGDG